MSLPQDTLLDLMAYADGELDAEGRARIEELVRTSDEARGVLAAMGTLGDVVREGVSDRADTAGADGIADAVMARLEPAAHGAPVIPLSRARKSARAGAIAGTAALVFAIAAGALLVMRTGKPSPGADNATFGSPAGAASSSPPATAPSTPASAVAAGEPPGVDLEEVSSENGKVDVFFVPSHAATGVAASVVVWITDGHSNGTK